MSIQFFLPLFTSMLQGALGHGMAANSATRDNNENARLARLRREEMQPIIDRLLATPDHFGMEENLVRNFSRASDQMAAQSAGSGMTNAGSGGLDQVRRDVLGAMVAQMSEAQNQDTLQREQLVAQILSDPSLYEGYRQDQSVGGNTFMGLLGGAAAGAGSLLPSFLSTKEGLDILGGLFAPQAPNTMQVQDLGSMPTGPGADWFDILSGFRPQAPNTTRGSFGGGGGLPPTYSR